MNILFFAKRGFNPKCGGIERVSDILASGFSAAGHRMYYATWQLEEAYGEFTPQYEQLVLPNQKNISALENIETFSEYVKSSNIDVIICHYALEKDVAELPYLVKEKTGVKLLYVFHSAPNFESLSLEYLPHPILPGEKRWDKQFRRITRVIFKKQKQAARNKKSSELFKSLYCMGDGLVVLSKNYIPIVQQLSGIQSTEKFFAIGNPNTYTATDVIVEKKENTVLFVGRLSLEKHPDKAMQLWQRVQHQFPNWNMQMLGSGWLKKDVEKLFDILKLESFSIEGSQDPQPYYAKAKIVIMVSDYEGFPMAITEAMQHGVVPVVFHTFAALTDVVEDNVTGVTVTPYDLDEFEKKLTALMRDEEKRAEMAEKGRVSVEKFALPNIIKQWENVFEKIR